MISNCCVRMINKYYFTMMKSNKANEWSGMQCLCVDIFWRLNKESLALNRHCRNKAKIVSPNSPFPQTLSYQFEPKPYNPIHTGKMAWADRRWRPHLLLTLFLPSRKTLRNFQYRMSTHLLTFKFHTRQRYSAASPPFCRRRPRPSTLNRERV